MNQRLAELRGLVAFGAIVLVIVGAWRWIEDRPVSDPIAAAATTTTTTTTTTVRVTTTTTPEMAAAATCERTATFLAEAELIPADAGPGPLARLALSYWSDLELIAIEDSKVEIAAVVAYYQSYLDTAEPFQFDPVQIILEGDKEKFEQLVTRPASGLEASANMVTFFCGVELPGQPSISARSFDDLEDRLLDP
ncbi:MAG: hypothetical protein AAGC53_09905 [Actinomycetota bacterium]